eukprot:180395-Alexandrium_andersonii.AAC.1
MARSRWLAASAALRCGRGELFRVSSLATTFRIQDSQGSGHSQEVRQALAGGGEARGGQCSLAA